MFTIPSFYQEEMSFERACEVVQNCNTLSLLDGLKRIDDVWAMFIKQERDFANGLIDQKLYSDDVDFFDHWCYEVSAYNIVKENISKLF
jgi:hypothetical protein